MSHLDHVVRVKEKLSEMGVTCPFKQRGIIDQAYIDALVAHHFTVNPSFTLSEKERDTYRAQLDRWNAVSPIGHAAIYSGVLSFVNLTFASLRTVGRVQSKHIDLALADGASPLLESEQTYKDLVGYLYQEVKAAHE